MLVLSVIAKVTVILTIALIGTRLAQRNRAAVRHAMLAAAFAVVLGLPLVSMVAPAVRIPTPFLTEVRNAPLFSPEPGFGSSAPLASAGRTGDATSAHSEPSALSLFSLVFAVWMAGVVLSLAPVLTGLWQIRSVRRTSLPWLYGQAAADALALEAGLRRRIEVLSHKALPGPMTCGLVRPAIVLPADAQNWDGEDLNRAMVHELEHVRRGDWAICCAARVLCAVYWFHPLVWMAWRRLSLEAERSCDDAVLGRSEATAYAEQLVALAGRLSADARSAVLAMANRSDLPARVGAVLDSSRQRGRARALPVALACATAVTVVAAMSPLRMVAELQSAPAQMAAAPEFDAVSVKLIDRDMRGSHSHEHNDPGRLIVTGTMHMFIARAYGITSGQMGGEPDWFKTHLYTIEAVTSSRTSPDQMLLMLRGALADRFQLKLREEDRDLPVYALEVAAGGPKFKALKAGEVPRDGAEIPGTLARSFTSVKDLMSSLNGVNGGRLTVDRPVVDRTHLNGEYNMQLRTEIETQANDFGGSTSVLPNLLQDMRDLGLKLVPDKVRMSYFVVVHAAEPTAN